MDPELYVFPKIQTPVLKIAASTALFAVVVTAARLFMTGAPDGLPGWLALPAGYALFIYASYQAWVAMREKNSVEDPQKGIPTRLLETGCYARARHPMYGMFILANAGLGLAAGSVYGLGFSLLSLVLFSLNGIFEERVWLIPQFGQAYREYMRRVPVRYFSLPQAALLAAAVLFHAVLVLWV